MKLWYQIRLLMYKNWLLQKKKVCVTIFEILIPVTFALFYVLIRNGTPRLLIGPIYYHQMTIEPNLKIFKNNDSIGYAPKTIGSEEVMNNFLLKLTLINQDLNVSLHGFSSVSDMVSFHHKNQSQVPVLFVFNMSSLEDVLPRKLHITIRPSWSREDWYTAEAAFPASEKQGPSFARNAYPGSGFVFLQNLIFQSVTQYWLDLYGPQNMSTSFTVLTRKFAFPSYDQDQLADSLKNSLPFWVFVSFLLSVVVFTKMIVYEKERQIKEYLRLMGMSQLAQRIAWFLTFCCYIVPIMAMYAALLCLEVSSNGPVIFYTNGSIIFCFLLIYGIAIITFCFMICAFVHTTNTGAVVAAIIYFTLFLGKFVADTRYEKMSRASKLMYCLSFNCAMALGMKCIGVSEIEAVGIQWSNIHKPVTVEDNLSVLDCLIMMLIDSAIHALIAWYFENVWPGEYGVPKPYNFCLNKSYWTSKLPTTDVGSVPNLSGNKHFEKEPTDKTVGIRISNLKKVFGTNVAVNGTSLNMYEGQITVLLGHNGAGKTTTMSMLTGFIPPTSGTAFINGHDIRTNLSAARESLGLCPQHDILFDSLTVDEHLTFFAKVKHVNSSDMKQVVGEMAKKVELDSKMTTRSKFLSGGQKRKLSVAIALLGSKVVVLDEPSSGVDPSARRHIWSVLQEARRGTTILLSTHFMDEADILGDRIAIMAHGVVKCCGCSMFLKNLYGSGYRLIVVIEKSCHVSSLTRFVAGFISDAELESVSNTEVTYFLPDSQSNQFANLFRNLEKEKKNLKIISFGASATTMEDVFFKAGVETITDEPAAVKKDDVEDAYAAVVGLNLIVVKKPTCDAGILTSTIKSVIPGTNIAMAKSNVVIYSIPDNEALLLENLVPNLHNRMDELGVKSFHKSSKKKSILNFASTNDVNDESIQKKKAEFVHDSKSMSLNTDIKKTTGALLVMSRIQGMFVKRIIYTKRKLVLTLILEAIPVCLMFLALYFSISSPIGSDPYLNFDLSPFGETYIPFTDGETSTANTTKFVNLYARQFGSSHKTEYFKTGKTATFDNYTLKRAEDLGAGFFKHKLIIGMELIDQQPNATACCIAYFSGQPYHSEPISVNYLLNTILQSLLNETFSLQTAIHPVSDDVKTNDSINELLSGALISIFLSFGMSFMVALFIYFLIMEREVGSRHMQAICGVRPMTYWLPNLLWDFLNYLIPILIIVMLLLVFKHPALTNDGRWAITGLALLLYCWAVISQMYAFQFMFKSAPSGVTWAIIFNIFTGVIIGTALTIASLVVNDKNRYYRGSEQLSVLLFPNYSLYTCMMNMVTNHFTTKMCQPIMEYCHLGIDSACCPNSCGDRCFFFYSNYIEWQKPGIGRLLFFMFMQGAMYFMIVMMLEYRVVEMVKSFIAGARGKHSTDISHTEDEDVAAERTRINSTKLSLLFQTDSLVLVNLYKRYKRFVAVDRICLGVPERECFGLLGQNGAGKTSTFKMLTGAQDVTEGNAYLNGFNLKTQIQKVQSKMGYCPQFDALIPEMTGRETLTMYARLRGIPGDKITMVSEMLADRLNVTPHIDKYVSQYSGGNKRKLSTAVALIGDPNCIMLDEPSSGMDPDARRHLWSVLSKVRASGCTLVLTSHSMEECDALCTRLAVMVNGRFMCLGSPQQMKNKFGQGYTLITELGVLEDRSTPNGPVIDFMLSNFPGAIVFDDNEGYIHFQVPDATIKLADIFDVMESAKSKLNIKSYYVQQTTLEEVFLMLTKTQVIQENP